MIRLFVIVLLIINLWLSFNYIDHSLGVIDFFIVIIKQPQFMKMNTLIH